MAHRIYTDTLPESGPLQIAGDEAHHAVRVKRLKQGDPVEILDGRGHIAYATIADTVKDHRGWLLNLDIHTRARQAPIAPRIEVYAPMPKGPRLSEMIDGLSQVGAARWSPLSTALTLGDPGSRIDRVQRIAAEASKQCGRAWLLEVGPPTTLKDLFHNNTAPIIIADASGSPYAPTGAPTIHLLIGPEGGWRDDELALAAEHGANRTRFGPHTMRIETAAVAAASIVIDLESRQP